MSLEITGSQNIKDKKLYIGCQEVFSGSINSADELNPVWPLPEYPW